MIPINPKCKTDYFNIKGKSLTVNVKKFFSLRFYFTLRVAT